MPLEKGSSRGVVSRNISEMVHHGHPQKQAVAAALRQSREGDNGIIEGADEKALDASIQSVGPASMTAAEINKKADTYWKQWARDDAPKPKSKSWSEIVGRNPKNLKNMSMVPDPDEGPPRCSSCGGPGMYLGNLGNREHFRCQNCGGEFSRTGSGPSGDDTKVRDPKDCAK